MYLLLKWRTVLSHRKNSKKDRKNKPFKGFYILCFSTAAEPPAAPAAFPVPVFDRDRENSRIEGDLGYCCEGDKIHDKRKEKNQNSYDFRRRRGNGSGN
jgi:hypothetical protein